ncbi:MULTISPECIES: hypothetical protein [unclassified Aurantimonas]|uniref:hypothetical protein n=1 Tax=unclassified Aurantimonas TaxID=2638230 RepID=UPI002E18A049|nr:MULTISPECIES: hypothetical protein [unclassified Aurantimonas]MEC5291569.1 hypothetical protein [Aurantimonas sp. C2-3-R2]MEC5412653.1 hypothetical protein [Aurantimonas sp. C2-4-R8]
MADIIDFQSRKITPDTNARQELPWGFSSQDIEGGMVRLSLTVPRTREGAMFQAMLAILEPEL